MIISILLKITFNYILYIYICIIYNFPKVLIFEISNRTHNKCVLRISCNVNIHITYIQLQKWLWKIENCVLFHTYFKKITI